MNFATETVLTGAEAVAAQAPLSPAELGRHFPQLEIIECFGRGGMGVVYKARQKSLNRIVALKLLAPERVADNEFAQRFTHEAQALAALNHPSIVTIYDFGQAGGFYFLLMEFVDGVNLRQAMKAGRFTPEQALAIVPPVCEALQYAHEQGIVHRDIKPENLLLDKVGRVKIADFGIAKMLDADGSEVGYAENQPAGTPQYMAPEQKFDERTDHRADIYSLGVVLYEMLTGELPADKLQPPSRKVQIDVRLDEIVLRALETRPELRYQTASEMRTQVESVVSTPQSQHEEAQPSSAPRLLKVCPSTLTTTAEIGTYRGQFFLWRTRGQLILDDRQLTHSRAGVNTVIPLASIRDLSIGQYPRSVNLAGIDLISVTYEEAGQRKQVLLSPMQGWFGFPSTWNTRIAEWVAAIREAIIAATGRAPGTTQASQLGLPRARLGLPILLTSIPMLVAMVLVSVLPTNPHNPGTIVGKTGLAFLIGIIAFVVLRRFIANARGPAAPALSRMAIAGACWAPFFFMACVKWFSARSDNAGSYTGPDGWQVVLQLTLLPLGITAPVGTTILGWLAVGRIRRSAARIYGLALAVFNGLLFPLLALSGLIGWMLLVVWRFGMDLFDYLRMQINSAFGTKLANFLARHHEIPILAAILAALIVDLIIIRRVWRLVNNRPPPDGSGVKDKPGNLAGQALGLVLVFVGLSVGWIQISNGRRASNERLAFMTSQISRLQSQWIKAQSEEIDTRNSLSEFESKTANPRTEAERRDLENEHQRMTNALAGALERCETLDKAVMDYTEKINHLQFPDSGTIKRGLLLTLPQEEAGGGLALLSPVIGRGIGTNEFRLLTTIAKVRHVGVWTFEVETEEGGSEMSELDFWAVAFDGTMPFPVVAQCNFAAETNGSKQFEMIVDAGGKRFTGWRSRIDGLNDYSWRATPSDRSYWVGPGEWNLNETNTLPLFEGMKHNDPSQRAVIRLKFSLFALPKRFNPAQRGQILASGQDWRAGLGLEPKIEKTDKPEHTNE